MSKNYLISLFILTALVGGIIFGWNYTMPAYANAHAYFILGYYFLFTFGIHYWLTRVGDAKTFIMKFLGATGIKLFLNLIIILVYGLKNKPGAVTFALFFLFIYFIYTFFEVVQLNKQFRKNESTDKNQS